MEEKKNIREDIRSVIYALSILRSIAGKGGIALSAAVLIAETFLGRTIRRTPMLNISLAVVMAAFAVVILMIYSKKADTESAVRELSMSEDTSVSSLRVLRNTYRRKINILTAASAVMFTGSAGLVLASNLSPEKISYAWPLLAVSLSLAYLSGSLITRIDKRVISEAIGNIEEKKREQLAASR